MNKKGFTLIELLAIIVILGVIAVAGYATVMPYVRSSKEKTFAIEANEVIEAAKGAMTLIKNEELDGTDYLLTRQYSETNGRGRITMKSENYYCFTLEDLVSLKFWTKNIDAVSGENKTYDGWVRVRKNTSGEYYYVISLKNSDDYYVKEVEGKVNKEDVQSGSASLPHCEISTLKSIEGGTMDPLPGGGLGGRS